MYTLTSLDIFLIIIYFSECLDVNVLGFIVLIACLVIGVRRGGIGLATISGIGLVFFIFVMGLKPGKPPVDVMLTIMAVVTCSAFLQASKGLDVMLKYAEKFLRSNPKYITILLRSQPGCLPFYAAPDM